MGRRNKKAHHVNASKRGFRGAIGGASPVGVGHTAGTNYSAFGKKSVPSGHNVSVVKGKAVGGGLSGKARKSPNPHGLKPGDTKLGIVDGHGSSNKSMTQRANGLFGSGNRSDAHKLGQGGKTRIIPPT